MFRRQSTVRKGRGVACSASLPSACVNDKLLICVTFSPFFGILNALLFQCVICIHIQIGTNPNFTYLKIVLELK